MEDFWFRKSDFASPLKYVELDTKRHGRKEYRLTESFAFEIGGFGSETFIAVPEGFVTDFASIPPGLRGMLPPNGPYAKAAVIHDYMYEFANDYGWSREYADLVFKEGMERLKVNFFTRWLMYTAVRVFGNKNFGNVSELNARSPRS